MWKAYAGVAWMAAAATYGLTLDGNTPPFTDLFHFVVAGHMLGAFGLTMSGLFSRRTG